MGNKWLRALIRWLLQHLTHIETCDTDYIPASGPFILTANHLGLLDILMIYYVTDHPALFIPVAEKWERFAFLRWLARRLNWVFIDRFNPDIKALRRMMRLLDAGNAMIIAPEGTRSRQESLLPGRPGAAYLAMKGGYTVIPAAVTGTEDRVVFGCWRRFCRPRVRLRAGRPYTLPPLPRRGREEALKTATDEVMCRIAALLPPRYRGVYAEHPRLQALLAQDAAFSSTNCEKDGSYG